MASVLDQIVGVASRALLRQADVAAISEVAPRFRRLDLDVHADWSPGQKVQVRTGGVAFRTFTPFATTAVSAALLVYEHGAGIVHEWADALEVGATIDLFGPRGSLDLGRIGPGPVLVGDETSIALAAAWTEHGGGATLLFEATDPLASAQAMDAVGLDARTIVPRTDDDAHVDELIERTVAAVTAAPEAALVLTGKHQTIKAIRLALKDAGLKREVRVKAYWDPNRSALD